MGVLMILELLFVYEAMLADLSGLQRVFGVFIGLAVALLRCSLVRSQGDLL